MGILDFIEALAPEPWSAAMSLPMKLAAIEDLPLTPASEVKKQGWRGVMRAVDRQGSLVVTHHSEPEAVILSVQAYRDIRQALEAGAAGAESALDSLRQRFDERLASLDAADAGDRLRALAREPAKLHGRVKAGSGF